MSAAMTQRQSREWLATLIMMPRIIFAATLYADKFTLSPPKMPLWLRKAAAGNFGQARFAADRWHLSGIAWTASKPTPVGVEVVKTEGVDVDLTWASQLLGGLASYTFVTPLHAAGYGRSCWFSGRLYPLLGVGGNPGPALQRFSIAVEF